MYQGLGSPEDAELFFRIGFHGTDSWCDADPTNLGSRDFRNRDLHYLHWLAKHGATSCQLRSFESERSKTIAYYMYYHIGRYIQYKLPPLTLKPWIQELNATALQADIADTCRCNCSPGGCTPLVFLLKGMCRYWYYMSEAITRFTLYVENFSADFEIRHHIAALRYLTYNWLGIPHACCSHSLGWRTALCTQDIEEIEDENSYELALLERLLDEFEPVLIAILQDPDQGIGDLIDFWQGTWLARMEDVLDSLKGNDLTDDEKRRAEEIGVVWHKMGPEPPEVIRNPYSKKTLDHWRYELEKIEAECH